VGLLAKKIVGDLLAKELIEPKISPEELITHAEEITLEELTVEDRVNEETRDILKKYAYEIEKGRLDYRKMFELTKKKIVQERGLIL